MIPHPDSITFVEPEPETRSAAEVDREYRIGSLVSARVPAKYLPALEIPLLPSVEAWMSMSPRPWSLTLTGTTGTGKSWQAARLLSEILRRAPMTYALWTSSLAAVEEIRSSFSGGGVSDLKEKLLSVRLLVLDDFGSEASSPWTRDVFGLIVSHRYDHVLPTILSTNLGAQQLAAIDPRVTSRLAEGLIIELDGDDRRAAS